MRLIKEAIVGDREAVQELIDSIADNPTFSQWPGEVELGGEIQPLLESFISDAFSIDYPDVKDGLKLFRRVTKARNILESLSSITPKWIIGSYEVGKTKDFPQVNSLLSRPKTFSITLPATLRFTSLGETIIEYNGDIRIGGNYRKDKENFGISMRVGLKLKFASADDFYPTLSSEPVNRYADLDLDSRKLEYRKIQHTPFTSLFKFGKDIPLFFKSSTQIKSDNLANLAILAYNGTLLGNSTGIQGEIKKTLSFFSSNSLYTNIEIEGLLFWNGKLGQSVQQPKLLQTIVREADQIPITDTFVRTEYTIQVFVFNQSDQLLYKQLATLSIRKIKSSYCGTILHFNELKQVHQPQMLELERIERDVQSLKEIQSTLPDYINRDRFVSAKVPSTAFNQSVLSFIRAIPSFLDQDIKDQFQFECFLGDDKQDLFSVKSLDESQEWRDFQNEEYDYSSSVTEEFVFDLTLNLFTSEHYKSDNILTYNGTLSIELETPIRTNLSLSLKANKTNSKQDRVYSPKRPVNRYANLDY